MPHKKEQARKNDARDAAELYAPAPEGSSILYGVIAVVLLGMGLWITGLFYGVNFLLHPLSLVLAIAIVFVGGIALRRSRKRRHVSAYDAEYDRRSD